MPTKPIAKEIKEEMISKIKAGTPAVEVARTYGVKANTVYNWISRSVQAGDPSASEIGRLKRENDELKKLVGAITLDLTRSKKKKGH